MTHPLFNEIKPIQIEHATIICFYFLNGVLFAVQHRSRLATPPDMCLTPKMLILKTNRIFRAYSTFKVVSHSIKISKIFQRNYWVDQFFNHNKAFVTNILFRFLLVQMMQLMLCCIKFGLTGVHSTKQRCTELSSSMSL